VLSNVFDTNVTSVLAKDDVLAAGAAVAATDLCISKWAVGINSTNVSDFNMGFGKGTPVNVITATHYNNGAANRDAFPFAGEGWVTGRTRIYFVWFDEMLLIDQSGNCSLVR
jgi:hypothetical protein